MKRAVALGAILALAVGGSVAQASPEATRPTMHVISDRGCNWIQTTTLLESDAPTSGRLGVKVYVDTHKVFVAWLSLGHRFDSVTVNRVWHDDTYRNHYVEIYRNRGDGQWALKRSVVTDPTACAS